LGNSVLDQVWHDLGTMPSLVDHPPLRYLDIAHGWAGILYASLQWCELTGQPTPAGLEERLHELARLAETAGRGLRFPIRLRKLGVSRPEDYLSSWCNGSAGQVFLWTLAHRYFRDHSFGRLAEGTALHAWEQSIDFDSLCCGLAGSAYALLNLYRHTGELVWLNRARQLADRAMAWTKSSEMPDSLYKGTLGVAVLAADILVPEHAAMPIFEAEGWPVRNRLSSD
jgi:serine/threonine-protein kinase